MSLLKFTPAPWPLARLAAIPALGLVLASGLAAQAAPVAPAARITASPAATVPITGRVLDEKGAGIPGVNVIEKGKANGTQTDPDGNYTITVEDNATLIFSFVGYKSQEQAVSGQTTISLSLTPETSNLNEVVVVGYGAQERKLLATSISSIAAKQVEMLPVASPSEAMVGLVAGAQVTEPSGEPGSTASIRVRGLGSISAGNNPLYVVDGYPLNSSESFNQISPQEIQSIQVLKDAAACAIYGSRGGNGIVIVTTKRGQAGKTRFNFNSYYGVMGVAKRVDVLNRDQYLEYFKDAYTNGGRTQPPALLADPSTYPDTDWQDQIFRTGTQQNYQLSASGGTTKGTFYISGAYFKQDGVLKGTSFDRASLRANYDAQLSKKVKISLSLAPSFNRTEAKPTSGNFNGASLTGGFPFGQGAAVTNALIMPPIIPVRVANGDYGLTSNVYGGAVAINGLVNPLASVELFEDNTKSARILSSFAIDYEILKGLTLRSNLGAELIDTRRVYYVPPTLPSGNSPNANLSRPILQGVDSRQINSTNYNWLWENTATYTRYLGKDHNITLLAGIAAQYNQNEGSAVNGQTGTYTTGEIQYPTGAGQLFGSVSYFANALSSVFGRFDYAFKERYILTAALRTDGSSRFGTDNRYATFPSVAVAWRLAEEPFFKAIPVISELKLRGSYGVTGNNNIGDYSYQSYQTAANYVFGSNSGTRAFGFAPNGLPIRDLTWETNTQVDVGLDVGVFRDRIYLTVAAYQRNTTDLLLNRNIPSVIGFTSRALDNVGEVRNRGLEFQLSAGVLTGPKLRWTSSANLSFNRNEVIALSGANEQLVFDAVTGYTSSIRVVPGQPIGTFYGYQQVGVYRDQADVDASAKWAGLGGSQPGDLKFADLNGDGKIDASDIGPIGNPFPNFTFGWQNQLNYGPFSLGFTIQGTQGNDILNGTDRYVFNFPGTTNARTNVLDRWRSPENPGDGMTPRVVSASAGTPSSLTSFSSFFLHDGSFVRLRNVALRYNLPGSLVKKAGLNSASLYVSGQNLYTFTDYFGYNPEANLYGNSTNPTYGVDQGSYPMSRTTTIGVNIGF